MTTDKQTTRWKRTVTDYGDPPRLYGVWQGMLQRCHNPKNRQYKDYGERGITVCDEWKNNYRCFKEWALKSGYKQGLTIDRINNNEGYSPQNCRWATYKEQNRNKRSNRNITLNGETKCLSEWAEFYGLGFPVVSRRLRDGWSEEAALTTPLYAKERGLSDMSKTAYTRTEELAKAKGLSTHKLEQLANVANGTICKWGDGRGIRTMSLVKIAKSLGVSVDYLLGINEEQ